MVHARLDSGNYRENQETESGMFVVIVPAAGSQGVYADNRLWAQQYVASDPQNRRLVELTDDTPEAAVTASQIAAGLAGPDGTVIYAVGHGGGDANRLEAGNADFAPHRRLRVTQFVAFWDVRTRGWDQLPAVSVIEGELNLALALRSPRERHQAVAQWQNRFFVNATRAVEQMRDRRRVQRYYEQIAEIYHRLPVERIILLTCNVGNSTAFLDELSTDFGVPVAGFRRRVVSQPFQRGRQRRVRMFLEGDEPGHGTNVEEAERELMPGATAQDRRTGRVLQTRPSAVSRPTSMRGGAVRPGSIGIRRP